MTLLTGINEAGVWHDRGETVIFIECDLGKFGQSAIGQTFLKLIFLWTIDVHLMPKCWLCMLLPNFITFMPF